MTMTTSNVSSYSNSAMYETSNDAHEIQVIQSGHDLIFNALCNRITSLDMIRNQMRWANQANFNYWFHYLISNYRSQDLLAAIRAAARIKDDSVIVDFFGAILEKKWVACELLIHLFA
jgi:hypothetical protein